MKNAILAGCACAAAATAAAQPSVDWSRIDAIVAAIERPRIPERVFDVAARGGVADGRTDALPAIRAAIDAAAAAGGGRVVLGRGVWFAKGPVHLKSRIELHLAEGARLLFSPEPADYLPVVKTRWEGTEVMTYSPLVYARDVEDVAITGPGTIDGNRESGFHAWHPKAEPDFQRLRRMGFDLVPVEQRVFGAGTHLRPPLVQLFGATRVLLDGYTITNAAFWVNHLAYAEHATVRGLRVDSRFPNNDGVDVDSSRYVLVEKCVFTTGDDSVVIKSGRDADGRRVARPSEHVVVRNNDMGGEDGIALGSEMSGGIRHVFFTDNVLRKGASAIRFKANLDRGGVVEDVGARNFTVESFERLFWFQLDYPGELGGNFPARYRNIVFENFRVQDVGTFFEAHAPAAAPLVDVLLRGISVTSAKTPFVLENVQGLRLEDVTIAGKKIEAPAP